MRDRYMKYMMLRRGSPIRAGVFLARPGTMILMLGKASARNLRNQRDGD